MKTINSPGNIYQTVARVVEKNNFTPIDNNEVNDLIRVIQMLMKMTTSSKKDIIHRILEQREEMKQNITR